MPTPEHAVPQREREDERKKASWERGSELGRPEGPKGGITEHCGL